MLSPSPSCKPQGERGTISREAPFSLLRIGRKTSRFAPILLSADALVRRRPVLRAMIPPQSKYSPCVRMASRCYFSYVSFWNLAMHLARPNIRIKDPKPRSSSARLGPPSTEACRPMEKSTILGHRLPHVVQRRLYVIECQARHSTLPNRPLLQLGAGWLCLPFPSGKYMRLVLVKGCPSPLPRPSQVKADARGLAHGRASHKKNGEPFSTNPPPSPHSDA
ncbi:hypothetical protein LZ30DRAFT_125417 [Colletotrichum cereale]|nr:hypothetical protein LZ30DRAFT_125417 [Colletotrichum cereale]